MDVSDCVGGHGRIRDLRLRKRDGQAVGSGGQGFATPNTFRCSSSARMASLVTRRKASLSLVNSAWISIRPGRGS